MMWGIMRNLLRITCLLGGNLSFLRVSLRRMLISFVKCLVPVSVTFLLIIRDLKNNEISWTIEDMNGAFSGLDKLRRLWVGFASWLPPCLTYTCWSPFCRMREFRTRGWIWSLPLVISPDECCYTRWVLISFSSYHGMAVFSNTLVSCDLF